MKVIREVGEAHRREIWVAIRPLSAGARGLAIKLLEGEAVVEDEVVVIKCVDVVDERLPRKPAPALVSLPVRAVFVTQIPLVDDSRRVQVVVVYYVVVNTNVLTIVNVFHKTRFAEAAFSITDSPYEGFTR